MVPRLAEASIEDGLLEIEWDSGYQPQFIKTLNLTRALKGAAGGRIVPL